ncbi:unnamed protein product [Ectocarpus sp. CCAP 1310/34]|nr:unnamed protein product [Ectocarpus sp. CCAP 1310/34]
MFLPLFGALGDTYGDGDEEKASYSWTRRGTGGDTEAGGSSSSSSKSGSLSTKEAAARQPVAVIGDNCTVTNGNSSLSTESTAQPSASGIVAEGVGTTALEIATAALASAEALAQQPFFPGARKNIVVAVESEQRARWCRSIVHTLERAGEVLGKKVKTGRGDGQAVRVLLDDVQDSIADLLQIIESYKSKNALSEVFVSSLCKKRQEEAEVAMKTAVQSFHSSSVEAHESLPNVAAATLNTAGLELHQRASKARRLSHNASPASCLQESAMMSKKKRGQHRMDQLQISASDVEGTNEVLGRGGFGTVYLADLHGLNTVAKVVVMELLPGGDLRHRLKQAKEPLNEKVLRKITRDVYCGMAFLHAKATVHADFKSANVLFDATGRGKPREMIAMSLPWAAPEVRIKTTTKVIRTTSLCSAIFWSTVHERRPLIITTLIRPSQYFGLPGFDHRDSSFEGDVYSFGVVAWECLSRGVPWKGVAGVDKLMLAVTAGERPPIPENAPHDIAALARACWAHNPGARPTFKKVLVDCTLGSTNGESEGSTNVNSMNIRSSGRNCSSGSTSNNIGNTDPHTS